MPRSNMDKLNFIIEHGQNLSDWESEFVDSIWKKTPETINNGLTFHQWKKLNEIYRRIENKIG